MRDIYGDLMDVNINRQFLDEEIDWHPRRLKDTGTLCNSLLVSKGIVEQGAKEKTPTLQPNLSDNPVEEYGR